jgi:hypothetical protein
MLLSLHKCTKYRCMSHSRVHNRGFFRLDLQMEGEPLIERKRHSDAAGANDVEAGGSAEYIMEPPRLQNSTACSKLAVGCCAFGCCVMIGFVLASILNTGPVVLVRSVIADVVAPASTTSAPPRPLPAILKRLRTMQRAVDPEDHGVSSDSMFAAFPTWKMNGSIQVEHALKDLSLAMLMLSNHLPSVQILFEHVEL